MNAPKQRTSFSILCILTLAATFSVSVAAQTNSTPAWTATASATIQPATTSAVPRLISFNGVIKNADSKPQVGEVKLTFSLYEAQEGGAPLWSETQSVTTDDQGHYSVVLGSTLTDGLPADLFTTAQPRWLGVLPALDGVTEQARVLLVSMPYALKAADAETLGGKPASAFVQLPPEPNSGTTSQSEPSAATATPSQTPERLQSGAIKTNVDGGGSTGYLPIWTGPTTLGNSNIWQGITSLKVGIGTTNPATKLSVLGNGLNINLGDYGCSTGYGAIGFGTTIDCNHYSVLGDGTNTYFNRPTGGTIYFRENNATQMQINPGGNVGIGVTAAATTALSVKGNGINIRIGDFGCGTGFAAIGMGAATPSCTNYTLMGDSSGNTYLNTNNKTIHFRGTNADLMTLPAQTGGYLPAQFQIALRIDLQDDIPFVASNVSGSGNGAGFPAIIATNNSTDKNGLSLEAGGPFGYCVVYESGDLACTGTKSAVVPVNGGQQDVALYAVEAPENWFEDFGSSQLVGGVATVRLEPTFAQTVNTGIEYHVFLTPKGDCKGLYLAKETASWFEVRELGGGTSRVAFDYRIVARRMGYESVRLADRTEQIRNWAARRAKNAHSQNRQTAKEVNDHNLQN